LRRMNYEAKAKAKRSATAVWLFLMQGGQTARGGKERITERRNKGRRVDGG